MRVYANMDSELPLAGVADYVRRVESMGFDGVYVPETTHDSLMVAALAVAASSTLQIGTAVTLAFPRSPMVTAYAAWDLQRFSGGRFVLGLGTQVKGNIQGRFATAWTAPAPRMRDYVSSLRAIWTRFQEGGRLRHETPNYQFDRLQPIFNPGPIEWPDIPVMLGGVNPELCRVAGQVADGLITHPTNSARIYLERVLLPAVAKGASEVGREPGSVAVIPMVPLVSGHTDDDVQRNREQYRAMFATLYSTPAYHATLKLLGLEGLGAQLHAASRRGEWDRMPSMISDELLDLACPSGRYDQFAELLLSRYRHLAHGLMLMIPQDAADDDAIADVVRRLQSGGMVEERVTA
jgi:probable F420-dependent oxidoreductase